MSLPTMWSRRNHREPTNGRPESITLKRAKSEQNLKVLLTFSTPASTASFKELSQSDYTKISLFLIGEIMNFPVHNLDFAVHKCSELIRLAFASFPDEIVLFFEFVLKF